MRWPFVRRSVYEAALARADVAEARVTTLSRGIVTVLSKPGRVGDGQLSRAEQPPRPTVSATAGHPLDSQIVYGAEVSAFMTAHDAHEVFARMLEDRVKCPEAFDLVRNGLVIGHADAVTP